VLAYTADAWTQAIIAASIFVPVVVTAVLAWAVLRGKRDDPDEQRWARLARERREAEARASAGCDATRRR
jgi:nitrogen fixation-related uncharacterized protein